MLSVAKAKKNIVNPSVIFRTDPELKQLLEDIATASGYDTLQEFMLDVSKGIIQNADPRVMATVQDIQERRLNRVQPKTKVPKEQSRREAAHEPGLK